MASLHHRPTPLQHLAPEPGGPPRAERVYLLLAGVFLGALVLTNLIAGKFFTVFGLTLSCGVIAYPVTFLCTDLISELYGLRRATLVVRVGFAVSVFVTFIVWLAAKVPIADNSYVDQASFLRVFGLVPGIVFGSMVAYLAAQSVDVRVFEVLRKLTGGRHLWLRNNGSTVFSQLLDTVLVVTLALVVWPRIDGNPETTTIDVSTWRQLIIGQYLFKAGVAFVDTPLFYVGTRLLRDWINAGPASMDGKISPSP
jgi:uncharacterized integral membrane protein (TIGR00697 family)